MKKHNKYKLLGLKALERASRKVAGTLLKSLNSITQRVIVTV